MAALPPGGREGRAARAGAAQPRARARAAGPARRGGHRLRRCRRPGARRRAGDARMGRGRAQARRVPGGPGPAGAGPRAGGRQAAAGALVLGGHARERRPRRSPRARAAPRRRAPRPTRSAVLRNNLAVLRELAGDVGRRGDDAARRARRGPLAAPDLQEPGRHPLPQRALRGGPRGLRARREARARPGRRSLLQARQHRLQAPRPRPRARELAPRDRAQSGPRAGPRQPRHAGRRINDPADDPGFAALARKISLGSGLAVEAYKDKCVRRRIAVRMRACGVHTYADYQALLDRSPAEYERLRDALTINVTRFYRNAETWNLLRRDLIPPLCATRLGSNPDLERRLLLGRGGLHPRDSRRRAPRARRPGPRARAAAAWMRPTWTA